MVFPAGGAYRILFPKERAPKIWIARAAKVQQPQTATPRRSGSTMSYTQPSGLGRPASLHAPLAGPEGKSS